MDKWDSINSMVYYKINKLVIGNPRGAFSDIMDVIRGSHRMKSMAIGIEGKMIESMIRERMASVRHIIDDKIMKNSSSEPMRVDLGWQ